jgi:putative metalloenzyme radical SAM/SPASM domain maturase
MIAMKPHPSKLYVETTTRCNLRCAMCVKQADGACIHDADMSMDVFQALAPAFSHLDSLILNGIGEPLLTPHLADMIAMARAAMTGGSIGFQTNGMLLTPELAKRLVEAGLDTVCLSVDMVEDGSLFHGGEDVSRTSNVFDSLRRAARDAGRDLSIGVEFVLMRDTAAALPRSLAWAAAQGAHFALVSHMLPYDTAMAEQSLFNPNTDASMAEFARWLAEAKARDIDLSRYFDILWKFYKTPQEAELVRFVMERQQAAQARGIPIHLSSLMQWSGPEKQAEQAWLTAILDEARRVAGQHGLVATLPPVAATHARTCEFIEHGVAHITADGDVRPCYFLWHQYSCIMDGGEKRITPRTFGNVRHTPILDIWNSPDYREFRAEVLDYAYPYCSNCPVVPCSDVTGQGRDFERDCFGLAIPCGHCIWCMGGVRCLL